MSEIELDVPKIPDFSLSEKQFLLAHGEAPEGTKEEVLAQIKEQALAPYYKYLSNELPLIFPFDQALHGELEARNQTEIVALQKAVAAAELEEETESDVVACVAKLANYYTEIVDRTNAVATLEKLLELTPGTGLKIDVLLTLARLDFFFSDFSGVARHLTEVEALIEKGGDWERRNRFKTYRGVYLMATRNFADAAKLLIDSLATFTLTELCLYEQVAQYAITTGVLTLDRVDLKAKVVDLPEILAIYSDAAQLEPLVSLTNLLYTCQYDCFFRHLLATHDELVVRNKYLRVHGRYFLREMRCKAYAQLLESYKLLLLKLMAHHFSVSEDFLDDDLCKFIPSKKLNCTIDRVNGIIETNRTDNKNSQYHQLIRLGDVLLTKLQKYGAAVKLSGAERV